ncbi:g-protein coupled receptor 98 [Trichonephila clavipes]|nr:g-protein coupled receptor 98 [Trichonephila clavipes]
MISVVIPGYLELESAHLRVPEDVGSLLIKVLRREGHDGQIRMRYHTVPLTAQPDSDFIPIEGELVFDDGEGMKVLKVDILDDTLRESPEQFRLELFEPSTGTGVLNFRHRGSVMRTDILIEDNDSMKDRLLFRKIPPFELCSELTGLQAESHVHHTG